MNAKDARIFIAGHAGLAGSAIHRALLAQSYSNLIVRTRQELDLLDQAAVRRFFQAERPQCVFVAAARVGGIYANSTQQTTFLYENLTIASNVIHAAAEAGTEKLLFLGSSCIYPRLAPQPMREEHLLTGPLEPTNEGYAIAKIAAVKLCEYYNREHRRHFISTIPTNLYGPGDNFHPTGSHVIPGIMRRIHEAKVGRLARVILWGTGTPLREFLHSDDLADALLVLMDRYEEAQTINVGSGEEVTIRQLAELICEITGYEGELEFDATKPDGPPRKAIDSSRLRNLGWEPRHPLREGLRSAYAWALEHGVLQS